MVRKLSFGGVELLQSLEIGNHLGFGNCDIPIQINFVYFPRTEFFFIV
jgi:hypothetical protein